MAKIVSKSKQMNVGNKKSRVVSNISDSGQYGVGYKKALEEEKQRISGTINSKPSNIDEVVIKLEE